MAYRRKGRKQWLADLRTQTGWWKGASLRTTNKDLATRVEIMWNDLAQEHRAWDVLARVLNGDLTILELYDQWNAAGRSVAALRQALNDTDLSALVEPFLKWYQATSNVKDDTIAHVRHHLRWLMPAGSTFLASQAEPAALSMKLASYPGRQNTRRKVHADWSVFFDWCRRVQCVIPKNPMSDVDRPARQREPIAFYELDSIHRVVDWQPTPERRALFALLYGTPIELSTALALTKADLLPEQKSIRAAGTKAHTRDRIIRVDDWAWKILWKHAKSVLHDAPLWPGWHRRTASRWHQETIGDGERRWKTIDGKVTRYAGDPIRAGLSLQKRIKLHAARDAWAVRNLRAGTPVEIVQKALGHASAKETLDTYGPFIPDGADRDHWQKHVAKAERARQRHLAS